MKKLFTSGYILLILLWAGNASAQLLTEPFDYTVHATSGLSAQSSGAWNIINTGDSILLNSGSLTYPGLAASSGNSVTYGGSGTDYYRGFASQTTGTVYYSFLINISSLGTITTTGGYALGLIDATTSNFAARLWIRLSGASNFNVGINPGSATANTVWSPATLSPGTTYLVVAAYQFVGGTSNDQAKIWVNPASLGGSEPAADATGTNLGATDHALIQRVFLRQDNTSNTPGVMIVDELRVGTTWAEVTPASAGAPTISLASGANASEPATIGTFTINFSTPTTSSTSINFAYTGSATFSSDYTITYSAGSTTSTVSTGTLTVPAGTSAVTVSASPVNDASIEGTENITLTISSPTAGYALGTPAATINIEDDDVPTVSVAAGINAGEPTIQGTFTVTLSNTAPAGGVTVNYTLTGTATLNSDYTNPQGGTITIPAGSNSGTIVINTTDDLIYEGTETVVTTLNSASAGYAISGATATINLTDNEPIPAVVINEVYGGGGNSGAAYKNDFIELYNPTGSAVSLIGWSVQYNSGTGTGSWQVTNLSGSIPANGYYLIQQAAGTGGTTDLPLPDATGGIAMAAGSGKVALVSNTTPLTGQNPVSGAIVDKVAYGTVTGGGFEGAGPAPAPSNTSSIQRNPKGFDTNNNNTDFIVLSEPTPSNSVADLTPPAIVTVFPADNSTGVNTSFTASITFGENVQKGTAGSIFLKKVSDGSTVQTISILSADVTVSGTNVLFNINSLAFNTAYYFEVSSGAFKDIAGNLFTGLSGNAAWNFTTAATAPAGVIGTTYSFGTCSGNLPDGFTQYSVTGSIIWGCTTFGRDAANPPLGSAPNGVQINGFANGTNVPNIDWFISPAFDLTATTFPLLSFWSRIAFNGAPLQLKISTNYSGTGDPNLATWADLNGKFPGLGTDAWTLSENINLSAFKQSKVFVAFVYTSTNDEGARWTLDDIRIINSPTPPPPALTVNTTDIQYTYVANGATADKTFIFTGNDLTANVTVTATGPFMVSKDGIAFSSSLTYSVSEANNIPKTVSVRFSPTQFNQNYVGTVTVATSTLSSVINLKGTSIDPATTLEVVNWNIEWFGSTGFGPTNENLQEQNVKTILQNTGADIYGLVEVVDENRLKNIVNQMPGYSYVIGNFGSRVNPPDATGGPLSEAQKLAFVYKTSLLSNVTTRTLINNTNTSSTSYNNWASGRYPFLMTADVTLNCVTKRISFILIHAKANTSPTATSYARRQAAANELRDTLMAFFPNDNIIILGDFNDDLDQSITAGFTTTSYSSLTMDNTNFFSPTLALSLAGKKSTVSYNDVIDHVMLSNDLQPFYMPGSANILTDVAGLVSNYGNTTTDHYPVFTRYQFKNTVSPVITSCPVVAPLCAVANNTYTIPAFTATDDCNVIIYSYTITGATARSGNTNNASGIFNIGTSTITWTVTDGFNTVTCQTIVVVNPAPTVSIPDANVLSTGVLPNTVYPGFTPASSITLTATPAGGTAGYTFLWSNGTSSSTATVSPATNTTYTVTVTDSKGCTANASKTINAVNISSASTSGYVIICHQTTQETNTIEVEPGTVAAHLLHGDKLGTCTAANIETLLRIIASPNPSRNYFTITVEGGNVAQRVSVTVSDINGKVIEKRDNILTKSFRLGSNYIPGVYFITAVQGKQKASLVLVKPRF